METYEKKYKELEGKIKKAYLYAQTDSTKAVLEDIMPELAESEDEKIRKEIIEYIKTGTYHKNWVVWLEKQGEKPQGKTALEAVEEEKADNANKVEPKDYSSIDPHFWKPVDKVKPKFKQGQWIVWKDKCYKVNYNGCGYELIDQNGLSTSLEYGTVDTSARLWDVTKDAKAGDVLVASDESVFIYAGSTDRHAKFYVALTKYGQINVGGGIWEDKNSVHPATKKQRDLLFQKMKEAGYEWDAEKKEPKKIDQTPAWSKEDEKNLKRAIWYVEHSAINVVKDTMLSEWLKSIKDRVQPQKQWKPSEEQIDALEHFVRSIGESGHASPYDANLKLVHSLFNDLKKLKS